MPTTNSRAGFGPDSGAGQWRHDLHVAIDTRPSGARTPSVTSADRFEEVLHELMKSPDCKTSSKTEATSANTDQQMSENVTTVSQQQGVLQLPHGQDAGPPAAVQSATPWAPPPPPLTRSAA